MVGKHERLRSSPIIVELPRMDHAAPITLRYRRRAINAKQARLRGRVALEPDFDLSAFKCSAVFDWIELFLSFDRPLSYSEVRNRLSPLSQSGIYAEGPNRERGHVGDSFIVKFQDPDMPLLRNSLITAFAMLGLSRPPTIHGVEISVDFRLKTKRLPEAQVLRQTLMGILALHLDVPKCVLYPDQDTSGWGADRIEREMRLRIPRSVRGKAINSPSVPTPSDPVLVRRLMDEDWVRYGDNQAPLWPKQKSSELRVDRSVNIGKRNSSYEIAIMDKQGDQRNSTRSSSVELPEHEKRVRIEITLRGKGIDHLGSSELYKLSPKSLTSLRRSFFRFLLPTIPSYANPTSFLDLMTAENEWKLLELFSLAGVFGVQHAQSRSLAVQRRVFKEWRKMNAIGEDVWLPSFPPKSEYGSGPQSNMVAFSQMNKRIEDGLTNLARRVFSNST